MGNFSIPKKSEIKRETDRAYARIRDWTKTELTRLRATSSTAICISLDNGNYLVGTQTVETINGSEWKADNKLFTNKSSAIIYCALMHKGRIKSADKLYNIDYKCGRLQFEKTIFGYRLGEAYAQHDQFKIDVIGSRFTLAKDRLALAKLELSKILSDAKYTIQD